MISSRNSFSSLIGLVGLMAAASAAGTNMSSAPTLRNAHKYKNYTPSRPSQHTELQREISAHNQEVTRLKYTKKSAQKHRKLFKQGTQSK